MLLEINPLVLPDIGLVFWNTIAFVILFFVFLLEVGIALLQSYVFVILLSIFLKDGISPVH